ncbi:hypothetical protein BDW02DRAFT_602254 [Decorospora gaudefroyi]|uniref:DUF3176 domain-containing protein n=1 Tax=Decorospora gaudefroyi TaxID=184978 RepID=A0A6A5K0S4_9PLEO|nr:hypothetical protein BDW02DRAFT_602254 [Decorospora gaudefroyi]
MSRLQKSPMHWPAFPDIPIYLDTGDERATAKTYGTTPTTPTTPETSTQSRPTHLSPAHIMAPPISPVEPSPTTTIETSSHRSVIWPIPEPPPEIQHQPDSRRPTLRFFPTQRPRVRLDAVPSLQIPDINEKTAISTIHPGLGILNGPPKPPSIEISAPLEEDIGDTPNIAERIEKRLYQYSISGNLLKRWLLEIISWVFSALCMAAVIIVLAILKDDPLTKWSLVETTGLTLNAYISILSKMAGAALILPVSEALGQLKWSWFQQNSKQMWDFEIFDSASRGPWGSFLLLVRTKGKALAALGAMITLCMMALDPFFQQVVDFPDRWALQETSSKIPRTKIYAPNRGKIFLDGEEALEDDRNMFVEIRKFAYGNGTQPVLFGNGTRPEIPLSCPTSNCTWPEYDTLGVCSQCVEVADLLTFKCLTNKVDWTAGGVEDESGYPNATMCGYFLNATSDNPILMSGYLVGSNGSSEGEALVTRNLPLTTLTNKEPLYGNGSIHFKDLRNTISDVVIVSAVNGSAATVYAHERPIAHECVLAWCVKTIRSSYEYGTYNEEIIETFYNTTTGPFPWVSVSYETEDDSGVEIAYLEDIVINAESPRDGRKISGFGTTRSKAESVMVGFTDFFPSFSTVVDRTAAPIMRFQTWSVGYAWTRELDFNPWSAPNNLSHHMERMATAMTNVVRSARGNEMLEGAAFSKENYVSVRWEWLTLPLGLLFMAFIFLAATIFKSALEKDEVGVLKNSAILTLLYGIPDNVRGQLTRSTSARTPRAKAKELKVKLNRNMSWRISGNLFSPLTPRVPRKQPPPGWI